MDQKQYRASRVEARSSKYPPLANVNRYDKGVSPYGVYQMAGNVSEWVSDWFDPEYYQRSLSTIRRGRVAGELKVFRGGSWNEDPEVARSAGRNVGTTGPLELLDGISLRGIRSARRSSGIRLYEVRSLLRPVPLA